MLFIPQEIKEKLAKLEDENSQLKSQIQFLQDELNNPQTTKKKSVLPGVFMGLLLLALCYIAFLHWSHRHDAPSGETESTTEYTIIHNDEIEKWNAGSHTDVVYRVQLGAYVDFDINKYKHNIDGLHRDSIDGFSKVSLGAFSRLENAQQFLREMLRLGLENSYVVAYKNDEPLGLIEAIKQEKP